MSTLLLKTKFYIPEPSPNTVSRTRLLERLDQGLAGKLTLVAAPAGFGKTTLLSCWIRKNSLLFAWVSLDEADNDPSVFWTYIVSALQQACEKGNQLLLSAIDPNQLPSLQTLLTTLVNELSASQQKIVLVLDDYHMISNADIHEKIRFLIDNLPSQLHLIVSTRADPPLPIARLRAKSQLCELRANDLRFTLPESTAFLNEILNLELNSADIETLEMRTEGWAAGLQLAALSMRGRSDKRAFIADFSGSHHFILEYLTEEVINRLPEAQHHFLLQTSGLDTFCASLCDRMLGITDSSVQLSELLRSNLFLIPLDDERTWFRYHHLFADLLKNRLQQEFSSEAIRDLYQQAGQWYQEQANLNQAIKYYLLAQNFEQAAELIEQAASGTMLHGQLTTLLHWIEALPESMLGSRPRLNFYRAWALSLGGEPKVAEQILRDAKSTLDTLPETPENLSLRGELAALLTGIIVYTNDPPKVLEEAQEALTYLSQENLISRARVYIAMSTAYAYSDQMEKAIQTYEQARDMALKAGNPFLAAAAIEMLVGIQIFHLGALRAAAENLEQALTLGEKKDGTHQVFTGTIHILLAELNIERNQLDLAEKYLDDGTRLIEASGISYSQTYVYCTKARFHLAQGEHKKAFEALAQARQASQDCPLMHTLIHNLSCQVKIAICLGDIETASEWIAAAPNLTREIPGNLPTYMREVRQISMARVFLAQGNSSAALDTLARIYPQAETSGRVAHIIEILLLKALTHKKQGNVLKAIKSLQQAVSLAALEGYTRIFLEEGKPVQELLPLLAGQNSNRLYVNKLLAAFDEKTAASKPFIQPGAQIPPRSALIEPLSERECEVLKLIAAGYTNQQIADALVVSLNTVKKHTTHIYGKLGVKNRAQAIAKGREFELVQ